MAADTPADAPMTTDPPPDIDHVTDRLGPFVAVYPGILLNVIAAFIVAPLLILVGIAGVGLLIWLVVTVAAFEVRMLKLAIVPLVGVFGWGLLKWAINNRKTRIVVCERGLAFEHPKGVRWFPYAEIQDVIQDRWKDGLDPNGRPFMKRDTTFLVKARDGAELGLSANLVHKHLTLARLVYDKTRPYAVPWTLKKS